MSPETVSPETTTPKAVKPDTGLTESYVQARQGRFGRNVLAEAKREPKWRGLSIFCSAATLASAFPWLRARQETRRRPLHDLLARA